MTRRAHGYGSRLYLRVLTTAFLFWLGGSALAIPIVTRTDITPFYSLSEVMAAKREGGLPTEIHGAPSENSTPGSILSPLRLPSRVGGGKLIPFKSGRRTASGLTRMVLLFNADDLSARAACREPEAVGARKGNGGLDVFAVLCRGGAYFSQAHLRDHTVSGETDPRYARAMMYLFVALMPSKDEVERDSGDDGRD